MSQPPFQRYWPIPAFLLLALTVLLWRLGSQSAAPPPDPAPRNEAAPSPPEVHAPRPADAAPAPATTPEISRALEQTDPRQRARHFGTAFQQWIETDAEAALAFLRGMPRSAEYSQALLLLLERISRGDPVRALQLARELAARREDGAIYSIIFDRLGRENLPLALEQLALVPPGSARENAIRALSDAWLRRDPSGALAWAQNLPDADDRAAALETTLRDLATRNPAEAIALAQQSLAGAALERTVLFALQVLSARDPEGASSYVAQLPPGDTQTNAAVDVARALAERDIPAALAWAKTLSVDLTQWLALNSVFTVWAQKDPAAVARYVLAMPAGPALEFVASHVAMLLSAQPAEAIAWAEALPSTAARDKALVMVASTWAQRAPADAVNWAASLREEPLRTHAVTGAHSYWMLRDPVAARAWLTAADLPPETKSTLLRTREIRP